MTTTPTLYRVLAAAALLSAATLVRAEPVIRHDVAYAETKDPEQTLDLYAPGGGKNLPVVIWIHGGGWEAGDKADDIGPKAAGCMERGYILVSVNYRLLYRPTEHPGSTRAAIGIPDMEGDIAHAIRWVHDNVATVGGNPDFLFVSGHSAGAQLAALLCTDESYLRAQGLSFASIRGCVPVDGDTYFPALQIHTSTPRLADAYRRKFPESAQEQLSAVMHVMDAKILPPFLLLHVVDFPETGTAVQAAILAQVLGKNGAQVQSFGAKGKTHLTLNADLGRRDDPATEAMFTFFAAQVWEAGYARNGLVHIRGQ